MPRPPAPPHSDAPVAGSAPAPASTQRNPAAPDPRPEYRVAAFGLAHRFQRLLEIVLRHARHNQYRFVLAGSRGPGDYDLALVDMTAKGGPEVASTLRRLPESRPVVTVGRRGDPTRACDDLLLQRFTMSVLDTLNRVVDQKLRAAGSRSAARAGAGLPGPGSGGPLDAYALLGRRPRALIVDDSPVVRRQLALALGQMSIDSEGVGSAAEAIDVLGARHYELMLVDVVMADLDGLQLTRRVKADPALRSMPVIVVTTRSSLRDLVRGALSGCNSYLVKPVSLQTLRETATRCLRKSLAGASRERLAVAGGSPTT